ncbi:hypothetical protein SAMN05443665_105927 [Actinomadura meyerae]|uniref:Uncharacterized protein n=1 Tax=Actinomadura meyerae TaxID=240840 RepID=A0A239P111_9ACTN|nr:hypothetical protein SAMN05443665_105927 [Actinomadura meyerae]
MGPVAVIPAHAGMIRRTRRAHASCGCVFRQEWSLRVGLWVVSTEVVCEFDLVSPGGQFSLAADSTVPGCDAHGIPGTILACAGSTDLPPAPRGPRRDHPRTGRLDLNQGPPGDHPRVRGEHCGAGPATRGRLGPSPRARGARLRRHGDVPDRGTIPACAGSTRYPRDADQLCEGSSPGARGARIAGRVRRVVAGTIPACAGSTGPPCPRTRSCRDHPRVRGEHQPRPGGEALEAGPSPRARGALVRRLVVQDRDGTIPACAGSTGRHVEF